MDIIFYICFEVFDFGICDFHSFTVDY